MKMNLKNLQPVIIVYIHTRGSKLLETWKPNFREMRLKDLPVSRKEILKIGKKYTVLVANNDGFNNREMVHVFKIGK